MEAVILGSGNVATHLAKALKKAGIVVTQLYGRNLAAARALAGEIGAAATDQLADIVPNADIYIIAVKDNAIAEVASGIQVGKGMVVHTSGSTDMEVLQPFFARYGVLYPLQSFSMDVPMDFSQVPLLLEANVKASLSVLRDLAQKLSPFIYEYSTEQRRTLHLGAVLVNNFANYFYGMAKQLMDERQADFELLYPLMQQTVLKAMQHDPGSVQTGPAIRDDRHIMQMHLQMLEGHADWQSLYRLISAAILKSKP